MNLEKKKKEGENFLESRNFLEDTNATGVCCKVNRQVAATPPGPHPATASGLFPGGDPTGTSGQLPRGQVTRLNATTEVEKR